MLLKSRKSNRTRYFLHRVNLHLPGKFSCLSTGLAGSRNNPENCHYLVENIPTVEDINKEYLLLYPVWLCWIWWVLASFKTEDSGRIFDTFHAQIQDNLCCLHHIKHKILLRPKNLPICNWVTSSLERFLESFFVFEIVVEALPRLKYFL